MRYFILLLVVFFSGCSLFGEEHKDAQVEFRLDNSSSYEEGLPIQIDFNSPGKSESFSAADFLDSKSVGPFQTATSGTLHVTAQLLDTNNEVAISETVKLPLKSDWEYGITVAVGPKNPINLCFGCQGSKAIAINSKLNFSETDSLFIVWGGNAISDPVNY